MRRRHFLAACASVPLSGKSYSGPVIDTHTHFYDPKRDGGVPWPPSSDTTLYRTVLPADYDRVTAGMNIKGTVVIEASPLLEDNQWILDLAKRSPVIVAFIGHLEPGKPSFATALARFGENPLFRGIRVGGRQFHDGLSNPEFMADLRRLAERGFTLDTLGNAGILPDTARLSDAIPDLRIVIDHLPYDAGEYGSFAKRPLVYAKVSGVLRKQGEPAPSLDPLWEAFGRERVLYGSNWPVSDKLGNYTDVMSAVKGYFESKNAAHEYFYANSIKAYGWKA